MLLAACFGSHVGHDIWRYIQDATASQRDGSNHSLLKCSLLGAVGRCLPQQKWRESQGNRYKPTLGLWADPSAGTIGEDA